MDCRALAEENVAERYLLGELKEQEREAFERHFLTCARCFDELQTQEVLREELGANHPQGELPQRPRSIRGSPLWLSVAATVTLAASLPIWWAHSTREIKPQGTPSRVPPTSVALRTPPRTDSPTEPVPASPVSVAELGRFDPPVYKAPVLRSPEDDARALFLDAMQHYARRDYLPAIEGFQAAVVRNPRVADARFFLGVSLLLDGDTDRGIAELKGTVEIGDSPYLEKAYFYLAKGWLQRGDLDAASVTLRELIALPGNPVRGVIVLSPTHRDAIQLASMVEVMRFQRSGAIK